MYSLDIPCDFESLRSFPFLYCFLQLCVATMAALPWKEQILCIRSNSYDLTESITKSTCLEHDLSHHAYPPYIWRYISSERSHLRLAGILIELSEIARNLLYCLRMFKMKMYESKLSAMWGNKKIFVHNARILRVFIPAVVFRPASGKRRKTKNSGKPVNWVCKSM